MNVYTPGPWHAEAFTWDAAATWDAWPLPKYIILNGSYERGGIVVGTADDETHARLIAAAPDMLAALERVNLGAPAFRGTPAGSAVRAAIAKARGE